MADSNGRLATRLGMAVQVALFGWLIYSHLATERRLAAMERTLHETRETALATRASTTASTPMSAVRPPHMPPQSRQAQDFMAKHHVEFSMYERLRTANDEWVAILRAAKSGQLNDEQLKAASLEHTRRLGALMPATNAELVRRFDEFLASVPGEHVVVTTADGMKFEAVPFD